jgi:hypothetical protein
MRARCLIAGSALVATSLLQPATAGAEAPTSGLTLEWGFGGNGLTDDDYMDEDGNGIDLAPLVGLHFAVHYRIIQYVSVGLLVHYGFILADGDDLEDEYSDFLGVIPEVRGHYAFGRFEPWLGFGIGYAMAHTSAEGDWRWGRFTADAKGFIALHGVGFGLGTGVNIYLTDSFSLSPFFRMIFGAWPTACYELVTDISGVGRNERDDCDDLDEVYDREPDDLPHLWIVGAAAAYTISI